MHREIIKRLLAWKASPLRKPLLLNGVRQVGKTYILREFGRLYYQQVAYFNFDENAELKELFQLTKDTQRLLDMLTLTTGQLITPQDTLIIFDEVQECPEALHALKYFCEEASDYHIACAGSLLGIALAAPSSFPVGKVNFMLLNPMTFTEFLLADGSETLVNYLAQLKEIAPLPQIIFNPLSEKLKMYFTTGGMPEPVRIWTQMRDLSLTEQALRNILSSYEQDFAKQPKLSDFPKITALWHSLPSQLAKENKKFLYKVVKTGARAREYEDALEWLVNAHLVYKVYRCSAPRLPLCSYDDVSAFKLYAVDVGLLRTMAQLSSTTFGQGNKLFTEFKGSLTENYILEALSAALTVPLRYWAKSNPPYEVEFLLQSDNAIYPVEVKAGTNVASKSLSKFKELFPNEIRLKLRYSLENLALEGDILNIPLFLADYTPLLINLATQKLEKA